jgi:hypothetical protein
MKKRKREYIIYSLFLSTILCFYSIESEESEEMYNYYIGAYTPKGTAIYFADISGWTEWNQDDKNNLTLWVLNIYGSCGACMLQEATKFYNCHNYAWCSSEGGPLGWIGTFERPHEEVKYWNDSSYIQEDNEAKAEKIAYIPWADHSAIATTVADVFISKWDSRPLVKHPRACNPYMSASVVYYYSRYIQNLSNKTYPIGTDKRITSHSTFTAGNNVVIANGAKIIFVSHGTMTLQSGFTVENGAQFTATTW